MRDPNPILNPIYDAAALFVDKALRNDDSLFTPGQPVWALEPIENLLGRFAKTSGGFNERLKQSLKEAEDLTIQLAAEMLYVQLFILVKKQGGYKRKEINAVLSLLPTSVSIPPTLDDALNFELLDEGRRYEIDRPQEQSKRGYETQRSRQVKSFLEFMRRWKKYPHRQRVDALNDPWQFKSIVVSHAAPSRGGSAQRETLLYITFPDTFEPVSSRDSKRAIANAPNFERFITELSGDDDRRILQIHPGLNAEYNKFVHFDEPEIEIIWRGETTADPRWNNFIHWAKRFYAWNGFNEDERDYKLAVSSNLKRAVEAVESDAADWPQVLKKAFGPPNNLTDWRMHDSFIKWCQQEPTLARSALLTLWHDSELSNDDMTAFINQVPKSAYGGMALVITSFLLMGKLDLRQYPMFRKQPFTKGYELTGYSKPPKQALIPAVYEHAIHFLDRILSEAKTRNLVLRDRLDAQGLLWKIAKSSAEHAPVSEWSEEERQSFLDYQNGIIADDDIYDDVYDEPDGDGPTMPPVLPSTLADLAEELLLSEEYLLQIDQLLADKGQVIFYGPPGTGKTYVAQRLAKHYAGSAGKVELVQFHPSYAYEDFIEGYRPRLVNDQPGFELVNGPLKRLAEQARTRPDDKFLLIIDEINRGNIAKVFGELYFLLEYRDEKVTLQYADANREPFTLPRNVWIIGTMNTADRSIALMDAALRRRFYFVEFFPDRPPIQGILRRWLQKNKPDMEWVADAVNAANTKMPDRHAAIGPSHFMKKDLTPEWVDTIWTFSILPLLEEQFFGEDRSEDFKLETLCRIAGIRRGSANDATEDSDATIKVEGV